MEQGKRSCANGLTAACFAHSPVWAKQAFAYRLFCTIAPPQITRRLQRLLKDAAVYPGIVLPPGVEIPPGVIVAPGTVFPPGWTPGDPLPPGASQPPIDWNNPPDGSPFPNDFLGPWLPGPPHGAGGSPPKVKFSQFYEPWASLDPAIWTLSPASRGAWSVSGGWLVSSYSGSEMAGSIYHTIAETLPVALSVEIKMRADSGTSSFDFYLYTGSILIEIKFRATAATNSVYLIDGSTIGTNNGLGTDNTWLLEVTAAGWTLKRNGALAAQNTTFTESALTPGLVNFYSNSGCFMRVDYLNILKA